MSLKRTGIEKPNPTDALTVNKEFADIYLDKDGKNKNGNIKALATLNQLTKKGLIKKKIFTTADRGNVAIFIHRLWEENEVSTLLIEAKKATSYVYTPFLPY